MRNGVLQKIDQMGGTLQKAYVMPKWYALTFDQKQDFAELWAAWAYRVPRGGRSQGGDHLILRDAMTGKDIGQFDNAGLTID